MNTDILRKGKTDEANRAIDGATAFARRCIVGLSGSEQYGWLLWRMATYGSWQPIYDSLGSLIGYRRRATSYEEYANGSGTCGVRMVDSWWEYR